MTKRQLEVGGILIEVNVDQNEVKRILQQKLDEAIKRAEKETVLWDTKELERQTCMSINTIKENFFYTEGFPKYKIGGKWYFPAEEAKNWILGWVKTIK